MAYNIPFALLIAFGGIYEHDTYGISLSLVTLFFSLFFLSSFISILNVRLNAEKRRIAFILSNLIYAVVIIVAAVLGYAYAAEMEQSNGLRSSNSTLDQKDERKNREKKSVTSEREMPYVSCS